MKICRSVAELEKYLQNCSTSSIGFVPTMGALHNGH
ncbi:MAG TPA: pantoate--beta-alanine ligase, partial [Campylobacterales bacterium]|nr:pantoate--beta-alanine ligase [Campylobacterales bacterium]